MLAKRSLLTTTMERQRQMAFCALQMILFRVVLFLLSVFALDVSAVRNYNVYKKYYAREICSSNGVPEYHLQETGLYSAARFSTSPNWKYYDKICTFRIIPPIGYGVILNVDFYLQINIINRCKGYIEIAEDKEISRECDPKDLFKKQVFITTGNMTVSYHINNVSSNALIISTLRDKNLVFHDEQYMPSYGFAITATAYQTRFQRCKGSQFECSGKRCIWSGFTCDRVDNCGVRSDENNYGSSDCARNEYTIPPPRNDGTNKIPSSSSENYKPGLGSAAGAVALVGIIFAVYRFLRFITHSRRRHSNIDVVPPTMPMQQPPYQHPPPTFAVNQSFETPSEVISRGDMGNVPKNDNPPWYWEVPGEKQYEWDQPSIMPTTPNERTYSPNTLSNLNPSAPPPPYPTSPL